MGIDLTYHPDGRVVIESRPRAVESSIGEAFGLSTTRTPALVTFFGASLSSGKDSQLQQVSEHLSDLEHGLGAGDT